MNKTYTFKNSKSYATEIKLSHGTEYAFGAKLGYTVSTDAKTPVVDDGVPASVSSEFSFAPYHQIKQRSLGE